MERQKPGATGKAASMYVSVPRTTDAGYSVDLIDTYRKKAVETAKDNGDENWLKRLVEVVLWRS